MSHMQQFLGLLLALHPGITLGDVLRTIWGVLRIESNQEEPPLTSSRAECISTASCIVA